MRNILILIISLSFLLQSCHNKNVKLPLSKIAGIQDTIYNNSKIWIFFNHKNGDTIAELNKNNKVTNTHLIYNIDKRLKLKHIKNHLNKIQLKKEKPGMHSNGKYMHSYLSYVDIESKKLSMVKFDSVKFKNMAAINSNIKLSFKVNNKTYLNDVLLEQGDLSKLIALYRSKNNQKINLVFDNEMTYGQYINNKAAIQVLEKDSIKFNKNEFLN